MARSLHDTFVTIPCGLSAGGAVEPDARSSLASGFRRATTPGRAASRRWCESSAACPRGCGCRWCAARRAAGRGLVDGDTAPKVLFEHLLTFLTCTGIARGRLCAFPLAKGVPENDAAGARRANSLRHCDLVRYDARAGRFRARVAASQFIGRITTAWSAVSDLCVGRE